MRVRSSLLSRDISAVRDTSRPVYPFFPSPYETDQTPPTQKNNPFHKKITPSVFLTDHKHSQSMKKVAGFRMFLSPPAPKSRCEHEKQFIQEKGNIVVKYIPLHKSRGILLLQPSNPLKVDRCESFIRLVWGKTLFFQRANKSNTSLANLNNHHS